MAIAPEPSSFELTQAEGESRGSDNQRSRTAEEFEVHMETYRAFLWGVMLFVAHIVVILAFMAIFLL